MKNSFVLGLLYLLPVFSFAESNSKYDQLAKLFFEGSKPESALFDGIYSGRCYTIHEKNEARPSALVSRTGSCSNDGPAFPGSSEELRAIFVGGGGDAADHFDTRTDSLDGEIRDWANNECKKNSALKDETDYLSANLDFETNNRPDIAFQWKKSGNFLVMKVVSLMSQPVSDAWGISRDYLKDRVEMYCYYFKK